MPHVNPIKLLRTTLLTLGLLGILHSNIQAGEIEQKAFVERFYQNILNRSSDTTGMTTWMDTIKTKSATQVAMGFLNSPELTNKNLSNEEFLDIMYQTMFDRLADSGGRNDWLEKMRNGRTKQSVMFGFFQSQEFKNLTDSFGVTQILPTDKPNLTGVESYVDRFYRLVLKRNYDENGFNDWVSQLTNKTKNPTEIANGFLFSPEYTNQNEDNSTYLDTCYQAFFGRDADSGGKNDWLNKITNQGYTRQQIFEGFTGSQEFTNLVNSFNLDNLNNTNSNKITFKGLEYGIITSPITGKQWLDRNLGATQVCTSSTDSTCYGDYYQWGRLADGHEKANSDTTTILATDIANIGNKFIINSIYPNDWTTEDFNGTLRAAQWKKADGTGVCPVGFRVPTLMELKNETISYTGINNTLLGAVKVTNSVTAFQNFLKIPVAGERLYFYYNSIFDQGLEGSVWVLDTFWDRTEYEYFNNLNADFTFGGGRAYGLSVRCINDITVDIVAPTITSASSLIVNENQLDGFTIIATDNSSITYSILGTDANLFDVNSITGEVTFNVEPDYETKNSYSIIVKATDSSNNSSNKDVTVNISDVLELPTFKSGDTWKGLVYNVITSPITGKQWLDRNIGANQVCTSSTDSACYGDYYQWGRLTDGHEKANSAISTTLATDILHAGSSFIQGNNDWTSEDVNGLLRMTQWKKLDGTGVCPVGFRVPTLIELKNETINNGVINSATAFQNFLKLPVAGSRDVLNDTSINHGYNLLGAVLVSSTDSLGVYYVYFDSDSANWGGGKRAGGHSVRCMKGN